MKHIYFLLSMILGFFMFGNNPAYCTNVKSLEAFAPACPGMTIITSSDSARCKGESNGKARVLVTATEPISYLWNDQNNQTSAQATGLAAGTYNVLITDGNGCVENASVTIYEPELITISSQVTPVSCNGQSDGAINLTVIGGNYGFYYNWSTNATTEDLNGLNANSYAVIVTDKKGCVNVKSINVSQPSPIAITKTTTNVTCKNANNGKINLSIVGGNPNYTFLWSNGKTTQNIDSLGVGTYSVTVTDTKGCTGTASANITEPSNSLSLNTIKTNPTCFNVNNGRIDLQISGGTGPFSYLWNNGFTGEDPSSLLAGNYSATVTDKNGCVAIANATLTSPSQITLSSSSTNVTMCGLSDGTATVNASGGIGNFTYLWNDASSQTTNTAIALNAGTFSVLVKDSNNCTSSTTVTVNYNGGLSASSSVTNVKCYGESTGSATVNPAGGDGNYSYLWINGKTSQTIDSIKAGTYSVTISDGNNCTFFKTVVVTEPPVILLDMTVSNPTCNGSDDGIINLNVSGGTAPYVYDWNGNSGSGNISSLTPGLYNLTITDSLGCIKTSSTNLTQPSPLGLNTSKQDVKCFNGNSGAIELTVSGGSAPYSYLWNNGETSQDIDTLSIGTYIVIVTDKYDCQANTSITINEPPAISLSAAVSNVKCPGLSNGSITLTVNGGQTPYTSYAWSNGNSSKDIIGLQEGFYDVVVTDFNNCQANLSLAITEPDTFNIAVNTTSATCNMSDGTATAIISGGTPNYTYLWTPSNQTSNTATGLSANLYSLIIVDANNCFANHSFAISNPSGPTVDISKQNTKCHNTTDGSIDFTISGSSTTFNYLILYNNDTLENKSQVISGAYSIDSLSTGNYTLYVTDSSGCATIKTIAINPPAALYASGVATNNVCFGSSLGEINLTVGGGTIPYSFAWSNGLGTEDLFSLPKGTYSVLVTDSNGCKASGQFNVNEGNKIIIGLENINKSSCPDTKDGSISINVTFANKPYTTVWNNNSTDTILNNVSKGSYLVVVTDSKGCTNSRTFILGSEDLCGKVDFDAIANAFTPNGDGKNETWIIKNIENYPDCKIDIFNRWGDLVFNSNGYRTPWDGKHQSNGNSVPSGTYYYVLNLGEGLDSMSGTITIVR